MAERTNRFERDTLSAKRVKVRFLISSELSLKVHAAAGSKWQMFLKIESFLSE
jgi:hypothetical protein